METGADGNGRSDPRKDVGRVWQTSGGRRTMKFTETSLPGAFLIEPEPIGDARGSFARVFCEREFAAHGLETRFPQHSHSHSRDRATLRGMHFQNAPHAEAKLVSCLAGAMHDVIVDLRPASPTCRRWAAFELTPANGRQLYIPKGFAHGFMTLAGDTVVRYLISEFHVPAAAEGFPHDDPAIGIDWPMRPAVMSERDRGWSALEQVGA